MTSFEEQLAWAKNPATDPHKLQELAATNPDLWPAIAANPQAYPALLEWLGQQNVPAVNQAIAQRNAASAMPSLPEPPAPFAAPEPVLPEEAKAPATSSEPAANLSDAIASKAIRFDPEQPLQKTPDADDQETMVMSAKDIESLGDEAVGSAEDNTEVVRKSLLGGVGAAAAAAGGAAVAADSAKASPSAAEQLRTQDAAGGFANPAVTPQATPATQLPQTPQEPQATQVNPFQAPQQPAPTVFSSATPVERQAPRTPVAGNQPASRQSLMGAPGGQGANYAGSFNGTGGNNGGGYPPVNQAAAAAAPVQKSPVPAKKGPSKVLRALMILLVIFAVVALSVTVYLLVGGNIGGGAQSDPTPAATETTEPATPLATPTETAETNEVKFPAPDGAVSATWFASPSGNIACQMNSSIVTCTIFENNYEAGGYQGCSGNSVTFSIDAEGNTVDQSCSASTVSADGAPELVYNTSSAAGNFACNSTESGMNCWNTITGASFFIAKQGWTQGTSGMVSENQVPWN